MQALDATLGRSLERSHEEGLVFALRIAQGFKKIEAHRDTALGIGASALPLRPIPDETASCVPPHFADIRIGQQEAQCHIAGKPSSETGDRLEKGGSETFVLVAPVDADHLDPQRPELSDIEQILHLSLL